MQLQVFLFCIVLVQFSFVYGSEDAQKSAVLDSTPNVVVPAGRYFIQNYEPGVNEGMYMDLGKGKKTGKTLIQDTIIAAIMSVIFALFAAFPLGAGSTMAMAASLGGAVYWEALTGAFLSISMHFFFTYHALYLGTTKIAWKISHPKGIDQNTTNAFALEYYEKANSEVPRSVQLSTFNTIPKAKKQGFPNAFVAKAAYYPQDAYVVYLKMYAKDDQDTGKWISNNGQECSLARHSMSAFKLIPVEKN